MKLIIHLFLLPVFLFTVSHNMIAGNYVIIPKPIEDVIRSQENQTNILKKTEQSYQNYGSIQQENEVQNSSETCEILFFALGLFLKPLLVIAAILGLLGLITELDDLSEGKTEKKEEKQICYTSQNLWLSFSSWVIMAIIL